MLELPVRTRVLFNFMLLSCFLGFSVKGLQFADHHFCTKLGPQTSLSSLQRSRIHSDYSRKVFMSTTSVASIGLNFDNVNLRKLPVDPETKNFCRPVKNAIFSRVQPTPVEKPRVVAFSADALKLIDVAVPVGDNDRSDIKVRTWTEEQLGEFLSGNKLLPGSDPAAHAYCGHQFGSFAGQLGDGAAISLGEVVNSSGQRWELQLKGAGLTPYSRHADGRKVLRSSIREFLCSEAMHYLGIPTTRAGSIITSSSTVQRDPFYDGRVIDEQCAIVSRIAPNFFRFGSFELFKGPVSGDEEVGRAGPSAGNIQLKKLLLDHVLTYYPEIDNGGSDEEKYAAFFEEITRRTAELVARWQAAGFVHGVLNTDNMSVMGLTIDYGPYAFIEFFDPEFTPNGSDGSGRYTYEKQQEICRWNLMKFAEALDPLLPVSHGKEIVTRLYDEHFEGVYMPLMRQKLGLISADAGDKELLSDLLRTMAATQTDFTDTFVALTEFVESTEPSSAGIVSAKQMEESREKLFGRLISRTAAPDEKAEMMRRKMKIHRLGMHPEQIRQLVALLESNPEQLSEMFGGAPIDDLRAEIYNEKAKLDKLMNAATEIKQLDSMNPKIKVDADRLSWSRWLKKYYARLEKDRESTAASSAGQQRVDGMFRANPTFVLRNWIAQDAIAAAETGDFSKVNAVLHMLKTPFAKEYRTFNNEDAESEGGSCSLNSNDLASLVKKYANVAPPSAGAAGLLCTCSS